ncbi:MAG: patatin-like phospholipase family protein [Gammaproteobacteria bacterium]|nr:patatin-like phospholipase family protein [Gammaproteobacteria bacterium]
MDTIPRYFITPILAGGGARLPAHVGVLQALKELGYGYRHLVGVSGGSVIAALAATGFSCEAMRRLFLQVDFSRFQGYSIFNLLLHGGLSDGVKFEQWMNEQLQGVCFADLETHLHIVATDVRSGQPVIFNRETAPELPVAKAVLYSISIPLLFSFHQYQQYLLVDGSILAEDGLFRDWAGDGTPVICFRIRDKRRADAGFAGHLVPLADYLVLLVRTFMSTISREYLNEAVWINTILIESDGLSPLEFRMTQAQKNRLYDLGYQTTCNILPVKMARRKSIENA